LAICPKCGGSMEKRGKGTDHNLRIEDRSILRVRHKRRLVSKSTRPLMYVCQKCGYVEFYVPTEFRKEMKTEHEDSKRRKPHGSEYYS
jgi:DNA-directed RNA polymerase subunit M/transcription elongation factor TFIIS